MKNALISFLISLTLIFVALNVPAKWFSFNYWFNDNLLSINGLTVEGEADDEGKSTKAGDGSQTDTEAQKTEPQSKPSPA